MDTTSIVVNLNAIQKFLQISIENTKKEIEDEHFNVEIVQKEILDEARKFSEHTDDFEILAEIQHHGGKTNLIDFTTDFYVALYFACSKCPNKNGRVILLRPGSIKGQVKRPRNPSRRVKSQDSVFVRLSKGFMVPKLDDVVIIPKLIKQPIFKLSFRGP